MAEIGVVLAGADSRRCAAWTRGLRTCGGLRVRAAAQGAAEAAALLERTGAEVLVLVADRPEELAALRAVRSRFGRRVGVLVCARREARLREALRLGADGVCALPVDPLALAAYIRLAAPGRGEGEAPTLRARAALLLREQGFSPAGKGYLLLLEALCAAVEEPELLAGPSGRLLARAAERCGREAGGARRDADRAIRQAWTRGAAAARERCFPWQSALDRRPTAAELTALLAPWLRTP